MVTSRRSLLQLASKPVVADIQPRFGMIYTTNKLTDTLCQKWRLVCHRYTGAWRSNTSSSFKICTAWIHRTVVLTILIFSIVRLHIPARCDRRVASIHAVDPSFHLAYEQSFGFFDNIPNAEWEQFYVEHARKSEHYRFPQDHDRYSNNQSASWIFSNWDPYFTCPHARKIGGLGGGSKWVCDIDRLQKVIERRKIYDEFWSAPKSFISASADNKLSYKAHCLVYSIGSNGNYVWEDALFEKLGNECEIHIFDPDPFDRPGMRESKNMHFHEWGLGSSYSLDWMYRQSKPRSRRNGSEMKRSRKLYSFQEIRKRLGHENCTIDLFKVDCEGCEWHTYKDWISADLRQLLMETHELPTLHHKKSTVFGILPAISVSEVFDSFHSNGYVLFSKEVNTMKGNGFSSEWSMFRLTSKFFSQGHD
jgi:hypothetical protein